MTVPQPLQKADADMPSHSERILALHSLGLRVRDISSLLGIHPLIVLRVTRDRIVTA